MNDPLQLAVTIPEVGDSQVATMAMLVQVMHHMENRSELTSADQHEIALWFRSRFGNDRT